MRCILFFFLSLLTIACSEGIVPRKPVAIKSGTEIKRSIAINQKIKAIEEDEIQKIIQKDTLHQYLNSGNGFWYFYTKKDSLGTSTPRKGDWVNFSYNIKTLKGQTIYSKKALQPKDYRIDKEELIFGLREGLKLLKVNESATFLIPSHLAYGFYGDLEKIGANTPIISEVTLNSIRKNNNN